MRQKTMDEMITYFNQQVSEMDIDRKYKMALLGMITAIGYKASAQSERKTGRWVKDFKNSVTCTNCNTQFNWENYEYCRDEWMAMTNYCPNCGAKMEGEQP